MVAFALDSPNRESRRRCGTAASAVTSQTLWSDASTNAPVPQANHPFQGMSQAPVTGLYDERARWYSPSLGTWISQDPAGYINGADTYQFVGSGPVGGVDPWGLAVARLGRSDLATLAGDVVYKLKTGSQPGVDGWQPDVARLFVAQELLTQEAEAPITTVAKVATLPLKVIKILAGGELAALKAAGKAALKALERALRSSGAAFYYHAWYGASTKCGRLDAHLAFTYDPVTHGFSGIIWGDVGFVPSSGFGEAPSPSNNTRPFSYTFSGTVKLGEHYFGLPIFPLGQEVDGIVSGSWRYNGGRH